MAPPPPMPQPALPPMREVTEDTPPDMLAGAMDLRVLLPDGHAVKMNVDRSTPMMDLLVHVTTANKMSPGSHVIQAVGEKGNILPYKPSTPIGALDTWTIQIVSKSKASGVSHKKAPLKASNQPFEQTFRLQVNLPRNQLFVTRVSPRTPLLEVLRHVCTEKGLDPDKYDLRNPMNPDEVLRLTCNLLDYKLQEVTVALRGTTVPHNHQSRHRIHATSAADIIALQHQQDISDKRRKSSGSTSTTNNSGGVFGFIFKRGSRSSVCEGSISSDSLGGQSISPARSDESLGPARSASPPLSSQQTLQRGGLQDQLRNQINSQMSRQQENPSHPVSLVSDKNLKQQMEGGQPPPPPLRHRKRRAPKPPVQNAENKKSSEFITPAPPSIPAPIPISCRKSRSLDNDEDEYGEEDIMVGGGRERTTLGKVKSTGQSGGASTGGTLISHSRNSSDSSGYHEASVLSESPESGVGGSGAPDTLPRRKQQQSQKSGVNVSSQVSSLSHSMGNLASNGPPSTVSSKTMTSSSSYSSLSASTSSLPGQKKKKAPAPPAPVPPAPAPQKQHVEAEVNSERVDAISNSALTKADEGKVPKVRKGTSLELDNAACIVKTTLEKSKSQPEKLTEHPKLVTLPTPTPNQSNGVNQPTTNPAPSAVGSDINPAASVNKLCPIVAPKPHPKVNPAVDAPRPWSGSGPDVELNRGTGDGSEVGSSAGSMTADSIDEVDYVRQDNAKAELIYSDKSVKPLLIDEPDKDTLYSHTAKINGIPPTLLPSPPPSLEFMGVEGEKPMDADGQVVGAVESEDLDWEYKLPAPPTGFEDDEVERGDGVVEGFITKKAEDERETWVAESETASIPSTLSSAPSHRKIQVDSQRAQHLPNFRMSTYKASSDDGWEDPREDLGRINVRREDGFTKSNGRTFVLLNSDNEVKSEKSYIEVGKHLFETWASVSSKSSLSKGHYSNLDLSNSVSYTNPGLVMTSFKDTAENGVNPSRAGLKNEACVVRVSSFGGKSTKALKRSLSSTSSLISRHSSNDGKDNTLEKFDGGVDGPLKNNHLPLKNGIRSNSLSHSSRTVSLHDLARNSIQEECRLRESLDNGYHEENTTPKIVSSKWKKPQGVIGAKYGAQRMNSLQNLRKTSSELSINQTGFTNGWKDGKCDLEESSAPPKAYQWQEHHMMDNGMQEPLKSLQVLKGVLPQLKKSLSIDLKDNDPDESCLDRDEKIEDVNETEKSKDMESDVDVQNINAKANSLPRPNHHQSNFELAQQDEVADLTPKRYSYAGPPSINFGTWSERPKSEVSLKRDSDYRIGVGQAPRIRETQSMLNSPMRQPKSVASCNPSLNSHVDPPCPPPKPVGSNRVSVNIVSATKPEAVSRLPIVRSVELKKTAAATLASKPGTVGSRPLSCKFPSDLCEELTGALASLVDANRNGENRQLEEVNERRRRQQIPSVSAAPPPPPDVIASTQQTANPVTNLRRVGSAVGHDSGAIRVNGFMSQEKRQGVVPFAPVVKGFRLNSIPSSTPVQLANHGQAVQHTAPVPPPPPAVVCGVALKKRVEPASGPKFSENPRDNLLSAIREFGGRENLKKTAVRYK